MRSVLMILAACFLAFGMCGCQCGQQPPSLVWQPFPYTQGQKTTPTRTVQVPYQAPSVQYVAPPAAVSGPCP